MKSTTVIWMGANNVGSADDSMGVFSGTYVECVLKLSEWLAPRSMAKRIDLVIARSEEEARGALRIRGRAKLIDTIESNSVLDTMTQIMEGSHVVD